MLAKCVLISAFFIQCFCAADAKKWPCLRSGGSSPQRFTLREMFAKERKWKGAEIGSKKSSDQAEKESKGKEIARKNTLADLIKKDERNEEQRHSEKEMQGTSTLSELIEMETNEEQQKHSENTPKAGDSRGKSVITAEMESVELVDGEQRGMDGKAQAGKRTLSQLLEEDEQNEVQTYSADMPKSDKSYDHLIAEEQEGMFGGKHTLLELLGIDPNQVQTYSADMPTKTGDSRGKSAIAPKMESDGLINGEEKGMLGGKRTLSQLLEEEEQNKAQTYSADMPKADDTRGKSAITPEMASSDHLIADEQKGLLRGKRTLLELLEEEHK
ncbi:hypothetical protein niasHT_032111 [Heterodera trifolii]|uniref:Uncharacterized protein n=1 Tax=Heterodera trifolii TaxID=157864 RepID=A0ABD2HV90_9BILA